MSTDELMAQAKHNLALLPEVAFTVGLGYHNVFAIERGKRAKVPLRCRHSAKELNAALGLSAEQVEAMEIGASRGWHREEIKELLDRSK